MTPPSTAQFDSALADVLHATKDKGPISAAHMAKCMRMFGIKASSQHAAQAFKRAGWTYVDGAWVKFPGVNIDSVHKDRK